MSLIVNQVDAGASPVGHPFQFMKTKKTIKTKNLFIFKIRGPYIGGMAVATATTEEEASISLRSLMLSQIQV